MRGEKLQKLSKEVKSDNYCYLRLQKVGYCYPNIGKMNYNCAFLGAPIIFSMKVL